MLLIVFIHTFLIQNAVIQQNDSKIQSATGLCNCLYLKEPIDFIIPLQVTLEPSIDLASINKLIYNKTTCCPFGFREVNLDNLTLCYTRKDREFFSDFYKNCSNNIFSLELYNRLDIDKLYPVWSEYKNAYPGGPFLDTRFNYHLHHELDPKYKVKYQNQSLLLEDDLCIVIDSVQSYMAVRCDEKHYRYCIIEPMAVDDDVKVENECKDFEDSLSFSSPVPMCLITLKYKPKAFSFHENTTTEELCRAESGLSALDRGILYVFHPRFLNKYGPLHLAKPHNRLSNGSFIVEVTLTLSNVVCERILTPAKVRLKLLLVENLPEISKNKNLFLRTINVIDVDHLFCFEDSAERFPNIVKIEKPGRYNGYKYKYMQVQTLNDGYFQCIYRDPLTKEVVESNKILYVQNEQSMLNVYAIKIQSSVVYNKNMLLKHHIDNLRDLMCGLEGINKQEDIMFCGATQSQLKIIRLGDILLKRRYLDSKTCLYHVGLRPNVKAVSSIAKSRAEVLYIRPVSYCEELQIENGNTIPQSPMDYTTEVGFVTYKCTGDFIEGVQWVKLSRLDRVLDELRNVVNESLPVDNVSSVIHKVNEIIEMDRNLEKSGSLLQMLDRLGSKVKFNESETVAKVVGTSVALLIGDTQPSRHLWGFKIYARNEIMFTKDSLEFVMQKPFPTSLNSKVNELVVVLPPSVAASKHRISFIAHRSDRAFRSSADGARSGYGTATVNSIVISVTVNDLRHFEKGEVIEIYFRPKKVNISRNERQTCAYWHFTGDDNETGYWSEEGCIFNRATRPDMLDICRCSHLTYFAEILLTKPVFSEANEMALEILSIIGCCVSIFGLIVVVITAATFRAWRRDFMNKIWLQLCVSMLLLSICFLIIVFAKFDHYDTACLLIGIALHYSVLCSCCWMFVAAVLSYRKLVIVYTTETSHRLMKISVFSYGAPCVVIGILVSVDPHAYAGRFDEKIPLGSFCYPSGLGCWIAVYVPVTAIFVVNWLLFVQIIRSLFASKGRRSGDSKEALRCVSVSCVLVLLFGLPWIAGLFSNNIVAAYLFTIMATFQGFFLFLFFIFGKSQTRNMWITKFRINPNFMAKYWGNNIFIVLKTPTGTRVENSDDLSRQNDDLSRQNDDLSRQNDDLSRQNDDLSRQNDYLSRQK